MDIKQAQNDSDIGSEKGNVEQYESGSIVEIQDPDEHLSAEERAAIVRNPLHPNFRQLIVAQYRKLLWKLDLTLIPWVSPLF